MDTSNEIWKDIEDWPFHQVSNKGQIRVLPGGKVQHRLITETELRILTPSKAGYMRVGRGKQMIYVHHFVLNAFYGPSPPGKEHCRHLNGNPADNRWPENIEWGTRAENEQDKIRHGRDNRGERQGSSKLIESQVFEIIRSDDTQAKLANRYGVSQATISNIRSGKRWAHLDEFEYKKKLSMKRIHLIPDMKPIEYPQMMLSFGS